MVRKQLYLEEAQDRALKKRAKELGVSEAEVVRRALDDALQGRRGARLGGSEAIDRVLERAQRMASGATAPDDYRFDRESLYEEGARVRRWDGEG